MRVLALALLLMAGVASAWAGESSGSVLSTRAMDQGPEWGLFSVPADPNIESAAVLDDLYQRNVGLVVLEMSWRTAEPQEGSFDAAYFLKQRERLFAFRRKGFGVVLNYGLHDAPEWLLNKPAARFVNQDGATYTASHEPNLVFNTALRADAQRYTNRVFEELGTDWYAVRIGGGHSGELTYPQLLDTSANTNDPCGERLNGTTCNYYWAYDGAAATSNPVPGWKPGEPSRNGEAREFLGWYMQALTAYQNWQIGSLRTAGYGGSAAVLYPSWGMRDGDFERAVATNLDGSSSPEINGEVQRGFDHARHIGGLVDPGAAVWGTWADEDGTLDWLAGLAAGQTPTLPVMGENAGPGTEGKVGTALEESRQNNLRAFFWIRYGEAHGAFVNALGLRNPAAGGAPPTRASPLRRAARRHRINGRGRLALVARGLPSISVAAARYYVRRALRRERMSIPRRRLSCRRVDRTTATCNVRSRRDGQTYQGRLTVRYRRSGPGAVWICTGEMSVARRRGAPIEGGRRPAP